MKAEILTLTCVALLGSCVPEEPPAGPPAPIGEELLSFSTALGLPGCAESAARRSESPAAGGLARGPARLRMLGEDERLRRARAHVTAQERARRFVAAAPVSQPSAAHRATADQVGPLPIDIQLGFALEGIANAIDFVGVLFIGGAVFSSQLAKFVQERAIEYEHAMSTAFGAESFVIREDIDATILRIEGLIDRAQWAGLGRTIWDGWKEARTLYLLIFDIPGHYGRYAWTMVITRFPGGFFGLLAFVAFASSAILKTAKLWVEMGP